MVYERSAAVGLGLALGFGTLLGGDALNAPDPSESCPTFPSKDPTGPFAERAIGSNAAKLALKDIVNIFGGKSIMAAIALDANPLQGNLEPYGYRSVFSTWVQSNGFIKRSPTQPCGFGFFCSYPVASCIGTRVSVWVWVYHFRGGGFLVERLGQVLSTFLVHWRH